MNVQQTIIKGIREQLFFNNYLVLPGFGGFVLKPNPSHFSVSGGLLVPPSKTVSFNLQLKQNDGILATWLQNKLDCSANEALNHLQDFSGFCSGILAAKRRLSLDGIGFFYLDFENNLCFEPQQDSNFLSKSFGLTPVSIKEIEGEVTAAKKEPVFIDRVLATHETTESVTKSRRNYRKLVTPVLLAAILISLLSLLVINSKMTGELRSSLLERNSKSMYVPIQYPALNIATTPDKSIAYVADANGIATMDIENNRSIAVRATANELARASSKPLKSLPKNYTAATNKFEVVVGCFAVAGNADRMVNRLSNQKIKAFVSGKNAKGMYVVSNGSFSTKEEAIQKLLAIKNSVPNAWIKKGD
jgi:hypothetical protein